MAKGIGVAASLAGMALAAGLAIEHLQPEQEAVLVGQHRVVRGFSHDGDKLPADHPLMLASSSIGDTDEVEPARPAAPAGAAAASSPGGAPEEPLMLRRHCSWGVPGRNPYKGSVELALRTARLPETVVHQIAADMRDKKPIDRVSITNGSIRADSSGRRFDASKVAMTYGRSLCVDTRVNFKKNHVERADLYEATDAKGNVVAVMVPDVCGNVSVLSEVAEADDLHGANAAGREGRNATMRRLPQALVYDAGSGRSRLASVVGPANAVSSPGTLGCLLAAALAALLHSHRRSRVKPALGR